MESRGSSSYWDTLLGYDNPARAIGPGAGMADSALIADIGGTDARFALLNEAKISQTVPRERGVGVSELLLVFFCCCDCLRARRCCGQADCAPIVQRFVYETSPQPAHCCCC